MPIVQAYQCPRTLELFVDKQLYRFHLKSLAKENRRHKKEARLRRNHEQTLRECRQNIRTLIELQKWILANSDVFMMNAKIVGYDWDRSPGPRRGFGKIYSFEFLSMRYNEQCSNSHCSPIGKPKNWLREDSMPIGYPGWRGRIKIRVENYDTFYNDLFKNTGINTGTGGGGEYEVILFVDDWPGLAKTAMLNKLSGSSSNDIYDFYDPENVF